MPIYTWKCLDCGEVTRKILKDRPELFKCCCGGQLEFTTDTTTRVVEVRDNGLMPKKVEQLSGIEDLIKNR